MYSLVNDGIKGDGLGHTECKIIRKEKKKMSKKNKVRTITEQEYEEYVKTLTGETPPEKTEE